MNDGQKGAKHALKDMTVAEFRDRLKDDPVILLPLGSHEEQGPHTPMGDYQLAEEIALRIAKESGAIAAPCLPFGYAEFFRGFAGGIQLRAATFRAVMNDMIEAFLDHGINRLLILNGHSTNTSLIDEVARNVRKRRDVSVASIDLWRSVPESLWTEIHGEHAQKARGHGGDPVTSVSMYLRPEQMRMDLVSPTRPAQAMGFPATGVQCVTIDGVQVNLPLNAHEIAPNGMLGGDASLASAQAGQSIVDYICSHCARVVEVMRQSDPRDLKPGAM